jgi:hypothetical protein
MIVELTNPYHLVTEPLEHCHRHSTFLLCVRRCWCKQIYCMASHIKYSNTVTHSLSMLAIINDCYCSLYLLCYLLLLLYSALLLLIKVCSKESAGLTFTASLDHGKRLCAVSAYTV